MRGARQVISLALLGIFAGACDTTQPLQLNEQTFVLSMRALGASVRLELSGVSGGETIEAELSRERYAELSLRRGDRVFVRPRRARVFGPDEETQSTAPDREGVL